MIETMKQKAIEINPMLGLEAAELIKMYFSTKTVNGIEGFIFTEKNYSKNIKTLMLSIISD